jgi:hypothetical protein
MTLLGAADAGPAQWIVESLTTFGKNVASIVPAGFESYARIFHPAQRSDPVSTNGVRWVRWSEIAAANVRTVHPHMEFEGIVPFHTFDGLNQRGSQPGLWDHVPNEGSFEEVEPLVSILRRFTGTRERCWFAMWEGWGRAFPLVRAGTPSVVHDTTENERSAPVFEVPSRSYYLFEGPIEAELDPANDDVFDGQSPSLWWPDDRSWCVATEIDFMSTLVGGSRECIKAILTSPDLEALPVRAEDPIGRDTVNPISRPLVPQPKRTLGLGALLERLSKKKDE